MAMARLVGVSLRGIRTPGSVPRSGPISGSVAIAV
jgi:hypothetical protein